MRSYILRNDDLTQNIVQHDPFIFGRKRGFAITIDFAVKNWSRMNHESPLSIESSSPKY